MNGQRANLEIIAPSVEEAIAQGLEELGLAEEQVDVEILDAGSRGLFGLGSRQARIRLTIKAPPKSASEGNVSAEREEMPSAEIRVTAQEEAESVEIGTEAEPVVIGPEVEEELAEEGELPEKDEVALQVARDTVVELLEKMKVKARVSASFGEAEEPRNRAPLLVDVSGEDLSVLIGPRAETLNALQYIAGLIIGKELGRSVPLSLDVEGYRRRRAQQIRQLARRMAEQAVKTGRRQVLEPMPASERRLVHIELRDHPEVTTESVDEEPRRKVTIIPRQS